MVCVVTSSTSIDFNCIHAKPFAEGVLAHSNHLPLKVNPYEDDPTRRMDWIIGWMQDELQIPTGRAE